MNHINGLNASNEDEFDTLLKDINISIFNGELTDIIEVTYAYKKVSGQQNINKTLFFDFLWKESSQDLYPSDIKKVEEKLFGKISDIDAFIKKLYALPKWNKQDTIKCDLLVWSLKYAKNCLSIALHWLPFESEKAWFNNNIDHVEIEKRIQIIEDLEEKNFWWKISENPDELTLCYDFLKNIFEKNKWKLSEEEQAEYQDKYLTKIERLLPFNYDKDDKGISWIQNTSSSTNKIDNEISREKYIKVFDIILNDLLWLDFEIRVEERSSIYDGPGYLSFPNNDEYNSLSIKRIIELIWHEIESHSTNLRTNESILGSFRWAGNLEKEEWLAMVTEKLLNGEKLHELWIPVHFPKVLMSELLNGEDLQRFLCLQNKIQPDKWSEWRFLRLKRNYPTQYQWWQHKDVSYGRWVLKVVDYIKNWWDIKDLYLWKVSIDDIPKIKEFISLQEDIWEKSNIHLPLFISEFILFSTDTDNHINQENFIYYLKNKYDFIDWANIEVPVTQFFQKRKLLKVLQLLDIRS